MSSNSANIIHENECAVKPPCTNEHLLTLQKNGLFKIKKHACTTDNSINNRLFCRLYPQ